MGDKTKVKVGPGLLYVAPLNTTEPTNLTTPWATVSASWIPLGYTEEGHEATIEPSFEPIEVAEELEPIRYEETSREITVAFSAAEMTYTNMSRAINGGTITTTGVGAAQIVTFEPPALGSVTRLMIGWESNDATERWVFRDCTQTGSVAIARRKAPDKALIPMEFKVVSPSAGVRPFKAIFANPV